MAIHDKDKRKDILTGNVVNPDENKIQNFDEEQHTHAGRVGGNTISGADSTSTGDAGGDFDRPGTEGNPVANDYVRKDLGNNNNAFNNAADSADNLNPLEDEVKIPDNVKFTDPASGFPGKGAIRTSDDDLASDNV